MKEDGTGADSRPCRTETGNARSARDRRGAATRTQRAAEPRERRIRSHVGTPCLAAQVHRRQRERGSRKGQDEPGDAARCANASAVAAQSGRNTVPGALEGPTPRETRHENRACCEIATSLGRVGTPWARPGRGCGARSANERVGPLGGCGRTAGMERDGALSPPPGDEERH